MSIARRAVLALLFLMPVAVDARSEDDRAWNALLDGGVLLLRHATAPGIGDPPGFKLDDCATQRNLSDAGRAEAVALGERLRRRGIRVGAVLTSAWCRTRDTARLAFPGVAIRDEPLFNSFFADRAREPEQTRSARELIASWNGPGALIVVTHQVNITALTGSAPSSAAGVVLVPRQGTIAVIGSLKP